jgi:hypothetical protein
MAWQGARISAYLGTLYPSHVAAIHITMPIAAPPRGFNSASLTAEERQDLDETYEGQRYNTGYQASA